MFVSLHAIQEERVLVREFVSAALELFHNAWRLAIGCDGEGLNLLETLRAGLASTTAAHPRAAKNRGQAGVFEALISLEKPETKSKLFTTCSADLAFSGTVYDQLQVNMLKFFAKGR
jgi:hypothetical protein